MSNPKPKVTLINVTSEALEMLLLAKSTRLAMTPSLLNNIRGMTIEEKLKEVEYIANTIPASWEFVDFIFLIENVTRAFTHQFVRGRHASYAQQTMRVLDVGGWTYGTGPSIEAAPPGYQEVYHDTMAMIAKAYETMTAKHNSHTGIKIEDARGVLPTNIHTNILVKMNLRTFVDTVRKRSSSRVQGEYRDVLALMKQRALEQLPWIEKFIERTFDKAAADLESLINQEIAPERRIAMIKLIDQMRMQS